MILIDHNQVLVNYGIEYFLINFKISLVYQLEVGKNFCYFLTDQ